MNALTPVPNADDATAIGPPTPSAPMTRAVERLAAPAGSSTAEMLQELRRAFPDSPLAVRVRALEALRKR